jgi:WD40 repeat protein
VWGLIAPGSVGGLLQRVSDFVFGYDYFISYKQEDGKNLPKQLADRLTEAGYRVFLDTTGYTAGDDLKQGTTRRVRMSAYTLLIARPGALTRSDWVVQEISACLAARKTPVIIDIDQAFLTTQGRDDDERQRLALLRELLADRLRIEEKGDGATGSPFDGEPSETLIGDLRRSFQGRRQDTWRARVFGFSAVVFAALAGAAVLLAINATRARLEAEAQARRARGGELAAQARLIENLHPQAAGLLAAEAAAVTQSAGDPLPNASFQALLETAVGLSGRGLPPLGGELRSLAAAPDGDQFVTGDDGGSAWLWRIEGDKVSPIRLDKAGSLNVSRAGFGAHARWLMTSGDGGDGCLWALPLGPASACRALAPFEGAFFLDPTISPNGRWLAAPENKDAVWLWDLSPTSGTPVAHKIGQSVDSARYTTFSPDSRWLAVRSISSKEIVFWDLDAPSADMQRLSSPGSEIDALDLRDEPPALAAADHNGAVYLWSLTSKERPAIVLNAATQDAEPAALSFDRTGDRLAVALAAKGKPGTTLLVWRLGGEGAAPRRVDLKLEVRKLDFDPTGRFLYIEGMNGDLALLDVKSETDADPVALPGHSATVTQHVFSRDGKRLVTGDNDGGVSFWDLSCLDGLTSPIAMRGLEESVTGLTLDPAHERWLAGVSADGTARLWDFTLPVPGDELAIARACDGLDQFAASPDRHWLAAANKAGDVSVYHLAAADSIASALNLAEGLGALQSLKFEPSGRWVAAITQDGAIYLWDLSAADTRASRRRIPLHHATETTVAPSVSIDFATDVAKMASTDSADFAWVTDYSETPPRSRALPGESREIWISPDGRWVASTDYDAVRLWDLAAPVDEDPSELAGRGDGVVALHFSRDS